MDHATIDHDLYEFMGWDKSVDVATCWAMEEAYQLTFTGSDLDADIPF